MKKVNHGQRENPERTLHFLDLDQAKMAVLASLCSPGSRRCYEHAMLEFIDWYCSEPRLGFNKGVSHDIECILKLAGWRRELSTSDSQLFVDWHMKLRTLGC